jgi:hypothetical protein
MAALRLVRQPVRVQVHPVSIAVQHASCAQRESERQQQRERERERKTERKKKKETIPAAAAMKCCPP